jgi:hypothetical protein
LIDRLIDLQKKKYGEARPVLETIYLKGVKKVNKENWENEDFIGHMYSSFLLCCVRPSLPSIHKHENNNSYCQNIWFNITQRNDSLFEKLTAIAYYRQIEREFIYKTKDIIQ